MSSTFGRTNRAFPAVWLSLCMPSLEKRSGEWRQELLEAAQATGTVLDVSAHPSFFASGLYHYEGPLMMVGKQTIHAGCDEKQVHDQIEALLFQCLTSLNRPAIDLFFWQVDEALEEFQVNAALETLEIARQEGVVTHLGLAVGRVPLAALALWQFHDAFEMVLVEPDSRTMMEGLAATRRVGLVTREGTEGTRLTTVRTPEQIEQAIGVLA